MTPATSPSATTTRPFLGYWPDPADEPTRVPGREPIALVTPDGAIIRGILWTPPGGAPWHSAVVMSHPRGDFSVHYACPLLADAGYAVFGFATRYVNNDIDCLHENCVTDVQTAVGEMRRRGAESVVLLGNCGGGSLMALSQSASSQQGEMFGDALITLAAHLGEGMFMQYVIDPSVTDEHDPLSVDPELDMYNPDNGWKPWPNPSTYDRAWLRRYRAAQLERIGRIDAQANDSLDNRRDAKARLGPLDRSTSAWSATRRQAVVVRYLTVYRTLADPAYLDPSIDPDDRVLGTVFAAPDPLDGNYGYGGLARTMTARGWLSTWSSLSSHAKLVDTMPKVKIPTLIVHPTGDTEIRLWQAEAIRDAAGAQDVTYETITGAPHYLDGFRREAFDVIIGWMRDRGFQ